MHPHNHTFWILSMAMAFAHFAVVYWWLLDDPTEGYLAGKYHEHRLLIALAVYCWAYLCQSHSWTRILIRRHYTQR